MRKTSPSPHTPAYLLVALALTSCSIFEGEEEPISNLTLNAGQRKLDNEWGPVDQQTTGGMQYDKFDPTALVGYEFGLFLSHEEDKHLDSSDDDLGDDDAKASSTIADLSIGLRKTFTRRGSNFYIGAGLALTYAEIEVDPQQGSDDDSSIAPGFYAHAGVYWNFWERYLFGLDYRVLAGADTDLENVGDADSSIVSLFFGYSF